MCVAGGAAWIHTVWDDQGRSPPLVSKRPVARSACDPHQLRRFRVMKALTSENVAARLPKEKLPYAEAALKQQ